MDVQELLTKPFESRLLAFLNSTSSNSDSAFLITSRWREQRGVPKLEEEYAQAAEGLESRYGLTFKRTRADEIACLVANPGQISLSEFRDEIYTSLARDLPDLSPDFNYDLELALALFLLRGSPDPAVELYAVDVKSSEERYFSNVEKLLLSSLDLWNRLNLNFRELQPQHVAGVAERNTQLRVNLKWFWDAVKPVAKSIHPYKARVLETIWRDLGEYRLYSNLEERMKVYQERVLGRELSSSEVETLRANLAFTDETAEGEAETEFTRRNRLIISLARELFDDECVGCREKYATDTRTFIMPRNNRYYFEVNHVVAFASSSSTVDVIDNLVKLCPACHRALTPGRATESLQKEIIANMVSSRVEVRNFVSARAKLASKELIEYVFDNLK